MGTFGFAEWEKPEDAEDVVKVRMPESWHDIS